MNYEEIIEKIEANDYEMFYMTYFLQGNAMQGWDYLEAIKTEEDFVYQITL